jgi:predicted nucleic acid-binding protein
LTLVDTNILLDLATDDSDWFDWSLSAIEEAASVGPLYINAIVFGELAARYASVKELNDFVATAGVGFVDLPREAAFLAAKAFARYRELGGTRTGVLSDFFIGAHALALDIPILTRDVTRYRTYFPDVRLISPRPN